MHNDYNIVLTFLAMHWPWAERVKTRYNYTKLVGVTARPVVDYLADIFQWACGTRDNYAKNR